MRIGLGCMRLSTELAGDEPTALATLAAAFDAGVVLFDTARAYAPGEADLGHNERLLARAWRARATTCSARLVTKCGMRREGGAWIPDGRAKRIAEDIAASVEALGGVSIDVLLLHAPDPRVTLATTGRALARAHDDGVVRAVGVSNVSLKQLEELLRVEARRRRGFARRRSGVGRDGAPNRAHRRDRRLSTSGRPSHLLVSSAPARHVPRVCASSSCRPSREHALRPKLYRPTHRPRAGDAVRGARKGTVTATTRAAPPGGREPIAADTSRDERDQDIAILQSATCDALLSDSA